MSNQLTALKELAEKVEAGTCKKFDVLFERVFYQQKEGVGMYPVYSASDAYHGSLDAAHSLHKAVLGDRWVCELTQLFVGKVLVANGEVTNKASKDWICWLVKWHGKVVEVEQPSAARAWLLAIIKAKITELEQ